MNSMGMIPSCRGCTQVATIVALVGLIRFTLTGFTGLLTVVALTAFIASATLIGHDIHR